MSTETAAPPTAARDGETPEERERSAGELALAAPLIYDSMDANRLGVIKSQLAEAAQRSDGLMMPTDADIAVALEMTAKYDLDFFAKEVWITKTKRGQLMIMVARDGLRKIARRNGLSIDSDAVREHDEFSVTRDPQTRERRVSHVYKGGKKARGELIGAWCEVYRNSDGKTMGYFFAPLDEYMPTHSGVKYTPWATQESVMILTAAERNALRQATPLSGLLGEGEMDLNEQVAAGEASGALSAAGIDAINVLLEKVPAPAEFVDELRTAIHAWNAAEPNAYGPARVQMALLHQDEDGLRRELAHIKEEGQLALDRRAEVARQAAEEKDVVDAEVVDERQDLGVAAEVVE